MVMILTPECGYGDVLPYRSKAKRGAKLGLRGKPLHTGGALLGLPVLMILSLI